MLKTLCNLDGVSGNENEVRDFIINKISPFVTSIETDTMGNLIAFKKGKNPNIKDRAQEEEKTTDETTIGE